MKLNDVGWDTIISVRFFVVLILLVLLVVGVQILNQKNLYDSKQDFEIPGSVLDNIRESNSSAESPNRVLAIRECYEDYIVFTAEDYYQIERVYPYLSPGNWAYDKITTAVDDSFKWNSELEFRQGESWRIKDDSKCSIYYPQKPTLVDIGKLELYTGEAERQFRDQRLFLTQAEMRNAGIENEDFLDDVSRKRFNRSEYLEHLRKENTGEKDKLYALEFVEPTTAGIQSSKYRIHALNGSNLTYRLVHGGPYRADTGYLILDRAIEEGSGFERSYAYQNHVFYRPKQGINVNFSLAKEYEKGSRIGETTIEPNQSFFSPAIVDVGDINIER